MAGFKNFHLNSFRLSGINVYYNRPPYVDAILHVLHLLPLVQKSIFRNMAVCVGVNKITQTRRQTTE